MSGSETVWIDLEQCTGCGECVEICSPGAISITDGKAYVDEDTCSGCEVCLDACPEGAIHLLVHGEITVIEEGPPLALRQPGPLVESAGAAAAIAGVSLLGKIVGWLARAAGCWLVERSALPQQSLGTTAGPSSRLEGGGAVGGERRARHRRRGA